MSERAIFYALLERADNSDCAIPPKMTPSLKQLAAAVCCSKSTVVLGLDHLEDHGWLTRARTIKTNAKGPGCGHKTTYQLLAGSECPPSCERHRWAPSPAADDTLLTPSKGSDSRTLSELKGSDSRTPKGSDSHLENRRSAPGLDEGISEGGSSRKVSLPEPDVRCVAVASSEGDSANGHSRVECAGPECHQQPRRGCRTCWEHTDYELHILNSLYGEPSFELIGFDLDGQALARCSGTAADFHRYTEILRSLSRPQEQIDTTDAMEQ